LFTNVYGSNTTLPASQKAKRCPTCNLDLYDGVNRSLVSDLSQSQPLAYRVLRRVKIRCPWQSCEWNGDYGDLQAHMVDSKDHDNLLASTPASSFKQLAQTFKEQANAKFAGKNYEDAAALYGKALTFFGTDDIPESDGLYR